ncbi:MAG: 6,7-dimethyl-8-ribityllumazine synthase [Bacteroidetes bacterium]|nr:MAG: 6,7-dimethyl-8-ribityllumazine synthase [Bacteroidota bacterium]
MAEIGNKKLLSKQSGILNTKDACVVIVRTEWNAAIVDELENGCRKVLAENGISNIRVVSVPGAFEIPFAIKSYWDEHEKKERPQAFIALGCVLRGDTPHFEYICQAVTDGILQVNLSLSVPTIFGVLTVNTQEQALERIGGAHGHKGEEAAITALKMISMVNAYKDKIV